MPNIWTYQGEVGGGLDGNVRSFEGESGRVVFQTLDADEFTWSVTLAQMVRGSELVPSEGQLVTLYRNGVRFFRGRALLPEQNGFGISCKVEGPWQWMEREPLSSAVTLHSNSGGGTGARASYAFPQQSMTVSLTTLINRMIALGAPFSLGTIATSFTCLQVTLKQGTFANALTELVRLIGDMSVWFDYSGSGNPSINITRRLSGLAAGSAEVVTIDARELEDGQFRVTPQDELRVAQVRVPYLDRATNGSRRYQEQKSGTAEAGHVLLLTASGTELDTFLPDEKLDSVNIQTLATNASNADTLAFVNVAEPFIKQLRMAYGTNWHGTSQSGLYASTFFMGGASLSYHSTAPNNFATPATYPTIGKTFQVNGQTIGGTKYIVTSDTALPDWFRSDNGIIVYDATLTTDLVVKFEWQGSSAPIGNLPGLAEYAARCRKLIENMYNLYGSGNPRVNYYVYGTSIPVKLIDISYQVLTTVYRRPDYQFIAPPSGFAAGLLGARNWTPHKGTIGWREQDAGGTRYMGKVVNLTNAEPSFASMRAMIQSEEVDLASGATRLQLGAPARLAFPNLLDAVRTHSNDQIIFT